MAKQPLIEMERRLKAGREYLIALKKLGFNPDALAWANVGSDNPSAPMELLIVTTWTDNIGPKAVYDLLFEAYDASATPKEIDPFIVSLFSPNTQVAIDLAGAMRAAEIESKKDGDFRPIFVLGMMDYYTIPDWVLYYRPSKSTRFEDARRFAAFQNNVSRLAA